MPIQNKTSQGYKRIQAKSPCNALERMLPMFIKKTNVCKVVLNQKPILFGYCYWYQWGQGKCPKSNAKQKPYIYKACLGPSRGPPGAVSGLQQNSKCNFDNFLKNLPSQKSHVYQKFKICRETRTNPNKSESFFFPFSFYFFIIYCFYAFNVCCLIASQILQVLFFSVCI